MTTFQIEIFKLIREFLFEALFDLKIVFKTHGKVVQFKLLVLLTNYNGQ